MKKNLCFLKSMFCFSFRSCSFSHHINHSDATFLNTFLYFFIPSIVLNTLTMHLMFLLFSLKNAASKLSGSFYFLNKYVRMMSPELPPMVMQYHFHVTPSVSRDQYTALPSAGSSCHVIRMYQ